MPLGGLRVNALYLFYTELAVITVKTNFELASNSLHSLMNTCLNIITEPTSKTTYRLTQHYIKY